MKNHLKSGKFMDFEWSIIFNIFEIQIEQNIFFSEFEMVGFQIPLYVKTF